jgi:hypothetical protein
MTAAKKPAPLHGDGLEQPTLEGIGMRIDSTPSRRGSEIAFATCPACQSEQGALIAEVRDWENRCLVCEQDRPAPAMSGGEQCAALAVMSLIGLLLAYALVQASIHPPIAYTIGAAQ